MMKNIEQLEIKRIRKSRENQLFFGIERLLELEEEKWSDCEIEKKIKDGIKNIRCDCN